MENYPKSQDVPPVAASNIGERELIQGLREKADWAFRELISRWSDKLYRLALRFLKRPEEAQEIIQEVSLKVVEKIDTFEGGSSLYTWLYRVTVNESLMRLRPDKGKRIVSWDEWEKLLPHCVDGIRTQEVADWSRLPDSLFAQKEVEDFLGQCVDALPEELKTAYLLKDVEGLSEEEVCKALTLTKPTMKNRVHRARLILRQQLEKQYVR